VLFFGLDSIVIFLRRNSYFMSNNGFWESIYSFKNSSRLQELVYQFKSAGMAS